MWFHSGSWDAEMAENSVSIFAPALSRAASWSLLSLSACFEGWHEINSLENILLAHMGLRAEACCKQNVSPSLKVPVARPKPPFAGTLRWPTNSVSIFVPALSRVASWSLLSLSACSEGWHEINSLGNILLAHIG